MNREEAFRQLSSDSARERIKAARFLARNSRPADLQQLQRALREETVSYVRTGLNLAIRYAASARPSVRGDPVTEFEVPPDVRSQIKAEAIQQVTGQILHEIASPVGLVEAAAKREIPDFATSKTKALLEGLRRIFDAIEQLRNATAVPKVVEFDLTELITNVGGYGGRGASN